MTVLNATQADYRTGPSVEKDFLQERPNWWLRYGVGLMAVALLALMALMLFLPYPDSLKGEVVFLPAQHEIEIYPPVKDYFYLNPKLPDDGQVLSGEVLAYGSQVGDISEILLLDSFLQLSTNPAEIAWPEFSKIGPLEESYSLLHQAWKAHQDFIQQEYFASANTALLREIASLTR